MPDLHPRRSPGPRARSLLPGLAPLLVLLACGAAAPTPPEPGPEPSQQEPSQQEPAASAPAPVPAPAPASAAPPEPRPGWEGPDRLVAIGDLHADLDSTLAVLRLAGLVDEAGAWSGGASVLVQTGDLTDRGPDSKELIELFDRLEDEAAAAGGRIVNLLGNHEVMNLTGDLRYVSPGDLADFESPEDRARAFSAQGELGAWLRGRGAVAQVGDTVFVHGGVSARMAEAAAQAGGVGALSQAVLVAIEEDPRAAVLGPEGPLWYRGYLQAPEALACAELDRALSALGARRMVVGHTTQRTGRIATRCQGALLGIDVGISPHYGRHLAAVEMVSGDARAIYPEGAEDLPDP